MFIIHDLTGEKLRTHLENAHITEKCKERIEESERHGDEDLKEMLEALIDIAQIETKGISDYIVQILSFINGYNLSELPYIVHVMKKVTEKLMEICKENDKKIGENAMTEKVDILWKMYGDSKIHLDRVGKTADKKNEEE